MNKHFASWAALLRRIPYYGAGILFVHRLNDGTLEVFLAKRRTKPHLGCWSIVGGKRETADGADFFTTAYREASEETCGGVPFERHLHKYIAGPLRPEELVHRGCHWVVFSWETYIVPFHNKPAKEEWPVVSSEFRYEFSDSGWFWICSLPEPLHPHLRKLIRLADKTTLNR